MDDITIHTRLAANLHLPSLESGQAADGDAKKAQLAEVHTLPFPRNESTSSDFESFTAQGKRYSTFHRGAKNRIVVGADSLEGPEFFKGIPGPKRGHRGVGLFAGVVWIGIGGNFAPFSISYERCIIIFLILLQIVSFPFVGMYLVLCQDEFDCQITQSLELFLSYSWHDDIFLARRVAQLLCRLGYCIWIDCACLPPGLPKEAEAKIGKTCRRAVEFCRTALVVWGANYMKAYKA
eukprot:gene14078-16643_t